VVHVLSPDLLESDTSRTQRSELTELAESRHVPSAVGVPDRISTTVVVSVTLASNKVMPQVKVVIDLAVEESHSVNAKEIVTYGVVVFHNLLY